MAKGKRDRERRRFGRWFHNTFDDVLFRALIGPAQTRNAVHGGDQASRDQWKQDLENRRRFSRRQRERKRLAREAKSSN